MVEIRTTLRAFKQLAEKSGNHIFESKGAVVSSIYGMVIMAEKRNPTKMFAESYPLKKLGYSGISSYEWEGMTDEDLRVECQDIVASLSAEELKMLIDLAKDRLEELNETVKES